MPIDFSIELTARKINDPRTKEYFAEVEGCYRAGYYRSCIVMLWSVVVCDLLYKLDQLANASGDPTAKSVLQEIEKNREGNPDSPRWEEKLLQLVRDRTELFDHATFLSLTTLQKQRHLSAHPVLEENDRLHTPSKEICRAHLRVALEGLLIRPAMMTRKIFDALLEDLEANVAVLIDEDSVSRYIGSKYLPYLSEEAKRDIFKRLWKIVFRLNNDRCQENREVNFLALSAFYADAQKAMLHDIENSSGYFSDILFEDCCAMPFHGFLRRFPEVFPVLTEAAQTGIRNFANSDPSRRILAWYLADSVSAHAQGTFAEFRDSINENIKTLKQLCQKLCEVGDQNACIEFAISQYTSSRSFDSADVRFDELIKPFLHRFSREQLIDLVSKANTNDQVHSRRKSSRDHGKLRKHLDRVGCDVSDYRTFENIACDLLELDEMEAADTDEFE